MMAPAKASMDKTALETHNRIQTDYFSRRLKSTMLPAATPYISRQVDEVLQLARVTSENRVLEVGCGMGRYTLELAARRIRIEGLDLTPSLLDQLRKFEAARFSIPLHCADIAQPPAQLLGRFDRIIGFFTLHHLHDLGACFQGMAGCLKPGGRIVFLEPNPFNLLYYLQILLTPGMTWQGDRGILNTRPGVVFSAMSGAGLADLRLKRCGFFPPFLANRSWAATLETSLELLPLLHPFLPFQLFHGRRDDLSPA
ncbi:MAG: class I SAM-dependent methyltransferase [Acidobacteriota bacterium]